MSSTWQVSVDNHLGGCLTRSTRSSQACWRKRGASRVTLRRDLPGDYAFPVTNEALAPGVGSLREEHTVDLRTQPVALEVAAGRQVVQDDSATAFDDPAFHRDAGDLRRPGRPDRHPGRR